MEQQQELVQIKPQENCVVGTEILDSKMPSVLNFEQTNQTQSISLHRGNHTHSHPIISKSSKIWSFSVKGSTKKTQVEYEVGCLILNHLETFKVKCYSQQKSKGLKKIWETVVGYVKRQLHFSNGWIYLMQNTNDGLVVLRYWELQRIFKIFLDESQSMLRIVLKSQKQSIKELVTKEFQVQNLSSIYLKIKQQIQKVGLKLV